MATKLTVEYLLENFDFDIESKIRTLSASKSAKITLNRTYSEAVILVMQNDCTVKCSADIEERLDTEERKDFFLQAQAYQLIYEFTNGKNSLIQPENNDINSKAFDFCTDTVRIIRYILGFNKPSLFTTR